MPFEDLFTYLGFAGLVAMIVFPLWKGDDFVSEQFGADVKSWLLRLNVPDRNYTLLTVDAILNTLLGQSLVSLRAFLCSCLVMILAYSVVIFVSDDVFFSFQAIGEIRLRALIMVVASLGGGYVSQIWTRAILKRAIASRKSWIVLIYLFADYLVSTAIVGCVLILNFDDWTTPFLAAVFVPAFFIADSDSQSFIHFVFGTGMVPSAALWANAMCYSLLIWFSAIGALVARSSTKLNNTYATLTYVLPLDEKPIRSIAIGFLLTILPILVIRAII